MFDAKVISTRATMLVRDSVNATCDKGEYPEGITCRIITVWSCYILGNMKFLLTTDLPDGKYYEVTYDAVQDKFYLDVYVRIINQCRDWFDTIGSGEAPEHDTEEPRTGEQA